LPSSNMRAGRSSLFWTDGAHGASENCGRL
jgi:hypothetical protein